MNQVATNSESNLWERLFVHGCTYVAEHMDVRERPAANALGFAAKAAPTSRSHKPLPVARFLWSLQFGRQFQQPAAAAFLIFDDPDGAIRSLLFFADAFAHLESFRFTGGRAVEFDPHQRF